VTPAGLVIPAIDPAHGVVTPQHRYYGD
jgi:hypothetical protein